MVQAEIYYYISDLVHRKKIKLFVLKRSAVCKEGALWK